MKQNELKRKKKKGFTLIELVIVIAILGILAVVAIPKFTGILSDAKTNSDEANKNSITNTITTLVAQDKIVLPAADKTISVAFVKGATSIAVTTSDTAMSDTDKTANTTAIQGAFNNIPSPKTGSYTTFTATIDHNGKVTVAVS